MAVVKGREIPVKQDPVVYRVREGIWIPDGLTFVNENTKYCAITGHVYNEEGSWYQMHVPEAEWNK